MISGLGGEFNAVAKLEIEKGESLYKIKNHINREINPIKLEFLDTPNRIIDKITRVEEELESSDILKEFIYKGQNILERTLSSVEYILLRDNKKLDEYRIFDLVKLASRYQFINEREWRDTNIPTINILKDWRSLDKSEYIIIEISNDCFLFRELLSLKFPELNFKLRFKQYFCIGELEVNNRQLYKRLYTECRTKQSEIIKRQILEELEV